MRRGNGTGSIAKLKGKRRKPWIARVTSGWTDEGKPIRNLIGSFRTRKEAEEALIKYENDPERFSRITLEELFLQWKDRRFKNISEATQEMYLANWKYYDELYDRRVASLTYDDFQNIIDENINFSRSYLKQFKSLGVQLCEFAMKMNVLDKNYAQFVELKREIKKEKIPFSLEERRILSENRGSFATDTILVMIYTGMRISEMLSLTKDKVFLKDGYLQHGMKTDAGINRIIPILPNIQDIFEKYMNKTDSEYVFSKSGKMMDSDNYRDREYYPALKELNLPLLSPHACRHTYATILNKYVSNKEHISRLLGHTDYSITANIYTHTEISELIESTKNME